MTCISIWYLQSTLMALNTGCGTICKFCVYSCSEAQLHSCDVLPKICVLHRHTACLVFCGCCTWLSTLQMDACEDFLLAQYLIGSHSFTRPAWMHQFFTHMKINVFTIHEKHKDPVASCLTCQSCSSCRGDVDLNRDFPDPLLLGSTGLHPTGDEQPETLALMKWTTQTHFVASASMHEVGNFILLDLAFDRRQGSVQGSNQSMQVCLHAETV